MANHARQVANRNKVPPASSDQLIVIHFEYNDIKDLDDEVSIVTSAFRKRGFHPHRIRIPMENSAMYLKRKLDKLLPTEHSDQTFVIYYNGHGGLEKDELILASHNHPDKVHELQRDAAEFWMALSQLGQDPGESNPELFKWCQKLVHEREVYQPIAEVSWSGIFRRIMSAKCDAAIILDCCDSGAAAIRGKKKKKKDLNGEVIRHMERQAHGEEPHYAKEILAACSWSESSKGHINQAILDVLNAPEQQGVISVETLCDKVADNLGNIRLQEHEDPPAQPIRMRLNGSISGKVRIAATTEHRGIVTGDTNVQLRETRQISADPPAGRNTGRVDRHRRRRDAIPE